MSVEPADQEQEEQAGSATAVSVVEWIGFVKGAARRHLLLGGAVAAVIAVLGIAVALVIPPTFESACKILVTQNVLPGLTNPNRSMPNIDPMRGVTEITMRKENLEAIIRDAKLVEQWDATRSTPYKIKDWVLEKALGSISDTDKMHAIVGILETKLSVRPEDTTTIGIRVSWGDPETAQLIAKLAKQKFLDARGGQETSAITAAIDILEDELKRTADAIEPELTAMTAARQKSRAARMGGGAPADAGAAPASSGAPAMQYVRPQAAPRPLGPSPTVSAKLAEIRQAEREIQEPWQRRLTELRLALSDLKVQYGPSHPSVVQQEARVRDASEEPASLVNLRQEERDLLSQIESGSIDAPSGAAGHWVPTRSGGGGGTAPTMPAAAMDEDPEVAAVRARLMSAIGKYGETKERLDAARIELTTAQTALKFRYVVVAEPEQARKPSKPNRPVLILASIAAALVAGLVAGAIRELLSGRVIEPWQVKQLGLPLLADVHLGDRSDT